jgi:hypothetical protein
MENFVADRKEFLKETTGALAQLSGVLREDKETPIHPDAIEKALRGIRFVRLLSNHFRMKEISTQSRRIENTLVAARKNLPQMNTDFKTWLMEVIKEIFLWISFDRKPENTFFSMPQIKQKGEFGQFISFRTPVGKTTLPFVLEMPTGYELEAKFLASAPKDYQSWDIGNILFGPKYSSLKNPGGQGLWYIKIPGTDSWVTSAWEPQVVEIPLADVIHPIKGTRFDSTPLVSGLVRKEDGFSALLHFRSSSIDC